MKKLVLALSVTFLASSVAFAQDDKKQEPKKDKKESKEEKKEEKPAGGTRMAINEKGQPGTKKNTNSTSKTTEKKDEPK